TAWAADLVVLIHFLYIVFLVAGPILFLRWRRVRAAHLAAVCLAVLIQGFAFLCPLTALEIWLRGGWAERGGQPGFIGRYIEPVVYPGLSQATITGLTLLLAAATIALYMWDPRKTPRARGSGG
ncbi:MAG TPA: DUF2784 domain-containing protein, partial [Candidatus Methylomirabilis sp.]|nr:DUF2784 domain-containing protein [Candidatus Methylomirabilis sp.]